MQPDPRPQPPIHETPFLINVERRGEATVLTLSGSCTMNEAANLSESVCRLASEEVRLIVLDMAAMDFIESTGLGGIVAAYLQLRQRDGELRLVAPPPSIMQVLMLTRLTQLFEVFATVEQALA